MTVEIKITKEKRKSVLDLVQICVDCGSIRTIRNYHKMRCFECGSIRYLVEPQKLFQSSPELGEIH